MTVSTRNVNKPGSFNTDIRNKYLALNKEKLIRGLLVQRHPESEGSCYFRRTRTFKRMSLDGYIIPGIPKWYCILAYILRTVLGATFKH